MKVCLLSNKVPWRLSKADQQLQITQFQHEWFNKLADTAPSAWAYVTLTVPSLKAPWTHLLSLSVLSFMRGIQWLVTWTKKARHITTKLENIPHWVNMWLGVCRQKAPHLFNGLLVVDWINYADNICLQIQNISIGIWCTLKIHD